MAARAPRDQDRPVGRATRGIASLAVSGCLAATDLRPGTVTSGTVPDVTPRSQTGFLALPRCQRHTVCCLRNERRNGLRLGHIDRVTALYLGDGRTGALRHRTLRLTSQVPPRPDGSTPLPDALQDQEKEMIEAALAESKGRVAGPRGAAAKLGIPPSTLESKIKQLKIEKSRFSTAS
jgi:regulatory Fis family protein